MNTYPLIAIGVTSLNSKKQQLDVRYLLIVNKDSQILNPLNLDHPGYDELQTLVENEKDIEGYKNALKSSLDLKGESGSSSPPNERRQIYIMYQ